MAIIRIAQLSKTSKTGTVRFCNIQLSKNTLNGDFYVSNHTGINIDKLKSSVPKDFRYEHKAIEFFNKQLSNKISLGFVLIENTENRVKFMNIEDLSFSYYAYLSKTKFKKLTDTCDDLYFKPSPKGERILLQIDVYDGVKAKTLRKTKLSIPDKLSKLLIETISNKMINNCFLDAYFDGKCVYILDVIAVEHQLVTLDTLKRHAWIEENLTKKMSKTLKILPCFNSKQFKKNKGSVKAFKTVTLHTYKLNAQPLPLKMLGDEKLMWLTCLPIQIKCIVLSNRNGNISLGFTHKGYTKEHVSIPEVNYKFEPLDVVSVAFCEETKLPIQIIGRLQDADFQDCTHPEIQLLKKRTNINLDKLQTTTKSL